MNKKLFVFVKYDRCPSKEVPLPAVCCLCEHILYLESDGWVSVGDGPAVKQEKGQETPTDHSLTTAVSWSADGSQLL